MIKRFSQFFLICFFISLEYASQAQNTFSYDSLLTATSYLYERTDFSIGLNASFTNPYDANEIALDMIITSPSGKSLVLPCFYISGDTVSGDSTLSVWNARFAPQESGTYIYHFRLSKNNVAVATTTSKQFNVLPSAKNGFIHSNSNWDDVYDNGKLFRGIGEDVGWEARTGEQQTNRYTYFLPKLAQNGANFFRTWMVNWNLPLECKQVFNTSFYSSSSKYYNPSGIAGMDHLVNLCDSLDIHMQLVIEPHVELVTEDQWSMDNYNAANGGPCATPSQFFTLPAAQSMFKNRLRYLVARWGYSPSIGAWELFNEVDNVSYDGNATAIIADSLVTKWHTIMSTYLKSIDIYNHMVTTSISWIDIAGLNSVPNIDYNQKHIYDNTSGIPGAITSYETSYSKPYVIGEFAYDWNAPTSSNDSNFLYDFKRGLWYGLFSSTPIVPMSWWWEFFDGQNGGQYMTGYFKSLTEISNEMLSAGKGSFLKRIISAGSLENYTVKCGNKYFVYLLNGGSSSVTVTPSLTVDTDTTYAITSLNPVTNVYDTLNNAIASSNSLSLGSLTLASQDEIVYIVSAPGDKTGVESPYLGTPANIPGKIEAENFNNGGEGVAYHDFDAANIPGYYRPAEGVDIDTTNDGSYDVTDIVIGEWIKYSVKVDTTGIYSVIVRCAAADTGKTFRLVLNNKDISGPIKVPKTGSLQNWATDTVKLQVPELTTGEGTLEIEMESSGFALDYLKFVLTNAAPIISSPSKDTSVTYPITIPITAQASSANGSISKVLFYNYSTKIGEADTVPYTINWPTTYGTNKIVAVATTDGLSLTSDTVIVNASEIWNIPDDTIQAENYDTGGEGVAYYDVTPGNKFGFYRHDDVDIEQCTDVGGGYDLGDFSTGEWVQYTVNVTQAGNYQVDFRVASDESGTGFSMSIDGTNVTGTISVPNTEGWETWTTLKAATGNLSQGKHVIRLTSVQQYLNINYFVFSLSTAVNNVTQSDLECYPNPVTSVMWFNNLPSQVKTVEIVNMLGIIVKSASANSNSIDMSTLHSGTYIINFLTSDNEILKHLIVVKL